MKTFDWEYLKKQASNHRYLWYKRHHKELITEANFIKAMRAIEQFSHSKNPNHSYSSYNLKKNYWNLRNKFGFFV